jgi:hypothetical protein
MAAILTFKAKCAKRNSLLVHTTYFFQSKAPYQCVQQILKPKVPPIQKIIKCCVVNDKLAFSPDITP